MGVLLAQMLGWFPVGLEPDPDLCATLDGFDFFFGASLDVVLALGGGCGLLGPPGAAE